MVEILIQGMEKGEQVQRFLFVGGFQFHRQNQAVNVHSLCQCDGAFHDQRDGVRVVLVDDILTTGATCSEAARMLKKAGASMVAAVVLARSEGPNST